MWSDCKYVQLCTQTYMYFDLIVISVHTHTHTHTHTLNYQAVVELTVSQDVLQTHQQWSGHWAQLWGRW